MPQIGLMFESSGENSLRSADGSFFEVQFKPPLSVPKEARDATVALINSRIWNNFPNISAAKNNNGFRYSPNNGTTWYATTLDNGLYTVDDLETELQQFVVSNAGAVTDITFQPEYSTGFLNILMPNGFRIDWTNNGNNNTFRKLIGFDNVAQNTITSTGQPIKGMNVGDFSSISSVEVHSSLGKASLNGISSDILDTFPLTAKPSFLNFYQAVHPIKTSASHLVGTELARVYFKLTGNNGQDIEVPDNFGLTLMLEYTL